MNKKLLKAWLPPVAYKKSGSCFEYFQFLLYHDKKLLLKNKTLKEKGKGKRAFLLTTGPSIKIENLKLLAGEDCFSVSNFFLHDDIQLIRPRFHFFAPYHPPLILDNYIDWLKQADKQLPPETGIFLGTETCSIVNKYKLFSKRQVHYLYLSGYPSENTVNITQPVLRPITGPLLILPVLIYMGYEKIYLLGCDHTVLRDFGKKITHFYDNAKDIRKNASDKNAWENIINSHEYSMRVFIQYEFYKKIISKNSQTQIINLSQDSWLDSFPKDTLTEVINTNLPSNSIKIQR